MALPSIRRATADDFTAIGDIAVSRGQPPTDSGADPAYCAHLLAHGTLLVAADDEGILGFGATRAVGGRTMLTDLFVAESAEGRGVGRAILEELWTDQAPARVTFSSQHARAVPLYARFGLAPLWSLFYLEGRPLQLAGRPAFELVPTSDAAAVELSLTGEDRRADYDFWLCRPAAQGIAVELDARPIAAGVATDTTLVHLACPDPEQAEGALFAALAACNGGTAALAVPGPHPAFGALLAVGFAIVDFDIHMATPGAAFAETFVYSPGLA